MLAKRSNKNRAFSPHLLSDSEHAEAEESVTEAEEDSTDLQVNIKDELPKSSNSQRIGSEEVTNTTGHPHH